MTRMSGLRLAAAAAFGLTLLAEAAAPRGAQAATIHLNLADADLTVTGSVITARNRLSRAGSVDQMLFEQPNPAGFPAADTVQFNGSGFTGSSTYDFRLSYTAATGAYSFALLNGAATGDVGFRSGGASSTIGHTNAALDYNILHVYAVSTTAGSSVTFSDLFFTPGAGLSTLGTLETSGGAAAGGTTTYDQWLALPTGQNLAAFDWTIGARVTLAAGGTNPSSGEGIKFEITGKRGEFTPPPPPPVVEVAEPATLALFGLGLAGLGLVRRRRG